MICLLCGRPANQITRLGYMCEEHFRVLPEVCDFCGDAEPLWNYPTADFPIPFLPHHVSHGDWVACANCHELIEVANWEELLAKSTVAYDYSETIIPALRKYHQMFAANRTGPAIRMGSA